MSSCRACIVAILILLAVNGPAFAQDIEPRRWAHLPVGMNIFGVGVVHTDGDIAFDPVLELEDATVDRKTVVASFLHAFNLLGSSARFDVRLPYADARWEGLLAGQRASTEREGFADPRLRLSVNFLGAPALKGEEYRKYRVSRPVHTTAGAALSVSLPLGEYKKDKLLNLGENRYVFRPQIGVVHTRERWSYELTGSVFLYTDNDDFFGNNKREQDPLYALQTHVVYTVPERWWVSVGAGHDHGGQSSINGEKSDDKKRDILYGISAGFPFGSRSSLKLAYIGSRTRKDVGTDSDNLALAYSIRF
jgi:hypothetical protein